MARNVRVMRCAPEDVFAVLNDGWLFPSWVVGASRMRDVASDWPREGSRLHHSFGVWPLLIDDSTSVLEFDPPHRMVLQARGWPVGEARVTLDVKPRGAGCVVRLQEVAAEGPGSLIPQQLLDLPLRVRNAETLRRLAHLAEGGAGR
ncbi:SRPBCC domain-containing protein [Microbacterium sp. cf332]|uniref:SRPBCC family protein n=1 Tax=Microbacterium sp. cf332 TaxID=1761804 RepID=UPI00087FD1EF|nr:SRPBCC domain-containing protein [Microbacterium sp. cf332]SDQ28440.1 Polyketide cyclase / dehydrase and lipid transport [Microbacterium sp. cf332]